MKMFWLELAYVIRSFVILAHAEKTDIQPGVKKIFTDREKFEYKCGNGFCICMTLNNAANCTGHGRRLQYIPKLPNNITALYFNFNHLQVINASTLRNISNLKLWWLDLSYNNVNNLAMDTFKNLNFLQYLTLGDINLDVAEVASTFSSLNKHSIEGIYLNPMSWQTVPENIFENLVGTRIEVINLSSKITEINVNIFSNLKYLNSLYLISNAITTFDLISNALNNLNMLDLSGNRLLEPPLFCDFKFNKSYIPKLTYLDLSANNLYHLKRGDFKCLPHLETLMLARNPLQIIGDNFISSLNSLSFLDTSFIASAVKIENYAFNSSSLQTLFYTLNDLYLSANYDPYYLLRNCLNLRTLDLFSTVLPSNNISLNRFFSSLKHVQELNIASTGIESIPEVLFSDIMSLRTLNINDNRIRSWDGNIFKNSKLSSLKLSGNHISVINETSFPSSMLRNMKKGSLRLDTNPYLCTCQTVGSINWFRKHADILSNYPQDYQCFLPSDLSGVLLKDYNPSPESCEEKNIALLVSVPVCVVSVATLSVILLVYKCRWRLRYGIYLFTNKYKHYDRIADSDDFVYTGFVIYSDDDRHWVHNELIHRMEDKEGFRLCIRLRDFEVGKVHVDNIVENMLLSEKIIVVLSNNFAKDEWCHFQLLLAETRLLKQNINMLVLFMLEEIQSNCLRASLYKLVMEKQYALWSDNEIGNNLFWEQAISQMKRTTVIN